MLGPVDYVLWLCSFSLEAFVVVCSVARGQFFRYFTLNCYMLAAACLDVTTYFVLTSYGFDSVEYRYFYYYSGALLTVLLYFAIMGLYQKAFAEMGVSRYVRGATVLLLAGTAWFSYMIVHQNVNNLTGRFVVELSQNLYFVGVLLTYVLWGAVVKLRETRARLVQLVLALGIYFSATAALYALKNLFPGLAFTKSITPLVGVWLPLAWAYTFTKIPEEARLATAQIATAHR